jgi:hypothetical protein
MRRPVLVVRLFWIAYCLFCLGAGAFLGYLIYRLSK